MGLGVWRLGCMFGVRGDTVWVCRLWSWVSGLCRLFWGIGSWVVGLWEGCLRVGDLILDCSMKARVWRHEEEEENEGEA